MIDLIEKFYSSFQALDAQGMMDCYHQDILFEDPAFGQLMGDEAKAMWSMLVESQQGKNFIVTYRDIDANQEAGTAHWEASYSFSQTGRAVHNVIQAQFRFKDGLIIEHRDDFNLHQWAKQALGLKGLLLGNTSFFKRKLNAQCRALLNKYMVKQAQTTFSE